MAVAEVVARVHPTMLIGTSTSAGAFTEAVARAAEAEGVASATLDGDLAAQVSALMRQPRCRSIRPD